MGVRTVRRASLGGIAALALVISAFAPSATAPATATPARTDAWDLRPHILWKPIPFPDLRKDQTAAYSRRHTGRRVWRLLEPAVIVQHLSGGATLDEAWAAFARNERDLGEKPGRCVHFLIDTDGTIYQLVDLEVRCRHAVGLNHVSIGIEHVGRTASSVLRNRAMMRSSLALSVWLMASDRIDVRDVIGDAEGVRSPYHRERYPAWRCLRGSDFRFPDMRTYRAALRDLARARDVPVGPSPDWVDPAC
jgi:N-acetylmuramoyl-L-alanine amidase